MAATHGAKTTSSWRRSTPLSVYPACSVGKSETSTRLRLLVKMPVDKANSRFTVSPSFRAMSTTETQQQTPTPAEIPYTTPQAMSRYVTDTGKILPRKYTGLSAKHQRAVTRTLKHSRNMLLSL